MRFSRVVRFASASSKSLFARPRLATAVGASLLASSAVWLAQSEETASVAPVAEEESKGKNAGIPIDGLRVYRISEMKEALEEGRVLVAYKLAVYDITEFVEGHPGGKSQIMLAAGGHVDPYWRLQQQHESQPHVMELLEQYRVGNLHADDQLPESDDVDAYIMDPQRDPRLTVRSPKPFNGETPDSVIVDNWITSNELFYTRNHFPVPLVNPENYELEIVTPDGETHTLTLDDLKKYRQHKVVATVQCAGNRRNELSKIKPLRGGQWDGGAISNAEWSGVALRDVLADLGFTQTSARVRHVHFSGLDGDESKSYGASIPAEIAFSAERDVLLATEMNGEPIPRDHGYPVRALVPGVVGARNVKWVSRIELSSEESSSHWQQKDYRGFPPNIDWDNVDWNSMPSIQELPVISSIATANVLREADDQVEILLKV